MASVIGTHIAGNPGGVVVHVPPNGNPSVSDYSPVLNIFEFGYPGSQSGVFANGVISASTGIQVTGLGVADDGPAINAAIAAIGADGAQTNATYFQTDKLHLKSPGYALVGSAVRTSVEAIA